MLSPWQKKAIHKLEGVDEDPLKLAILEMNITLIILFIIPVLLILSLPIVSIIERYNEGKRQQTVEKADSYQKAITEWEKELQNGTF